MLKQLCYFISIFFFSVSMAQASKLSYSNVGFSYVKQSIDDSNDSKSLNLLVNFALTKDFFLMAKYNEGNFYDDSNAEHVSHKIGIGYHFQLDQDTDMVVSFAYTEADIEDLSINFEIAGSEELALLSSEQSGYSFSAGIHNKVNDKFELNVDLIHLDVDLEAVTTASFMGSQVVVDSEFSSRDTYFALSAYYYLTDSLSLSFSSSSLTNSDIAEFGFRLDF